MLAESRPNLTVIASCWRCTPGRFACGGGLLTGLRGSGFRTAGEHTVRQAGYSGRRRGAGGRIGAEGGREDGEGFQLVPGLWRLLTDFKTYSTLLKTLPTLPRHDSITFSSERILPNASPEPSPGASALSIAVPRPSKTAPAAPAEQGNPPMSAGAKLGHSAPRERRSAAE